MLVGRSMYVSWLCLECTWRHARWWESEGCECMCACVSVSVLRSHAWRRVCMKAQLVVSMRMSACCSAWKPCLQFPKSDTPTLTHTHTHTLPPRLIFRALSQKHTQTQTPRLTYPNQPHSTITQSHKTTLTNRGDARGGLGGALARPCLAIAPPE